MRSTSSFLLLLICVITEATYLKNLWCEWVSLGFPQKTCTAVWKEDMTPGRSSMASHSVTVSTVPQFNLEKFLKGYKDLYSPDLNFLPQRSACILWYNNPSCNWNITSCFGIFCCNMYCTSSVVSGIIGLMWSTCLYSTLWPCDCDPRFTHCEVIMI